MSRRSEKFARWLVWSVSAFSVLLVLASLPLIVANRDAPIQSYYGTFWLEALFVIVFLSVPVIGALIASRRPENRIGWLMGLSGVSFALSIFSNEYAVFTTYTAPGALPDGPFMTWTASTWSWIPGYGLLGAIFLLFPTGRVVSQRWRPVLLLLVVAIVALMIGYALRPGPFDPPWQSVDNPYAPVGAAGQAIGVVVLLGNALGAVVLVVGAGSIVLRFREAHAVERQQLKWLAFGASLVAAYIPVGLVVFYVKALNFLFVPVSVVGVAAFTILPIAIAVAILRYRLYDIDRIISRTLAYAVLTAVLAAVYLVGFLGIQALLASFTGNGEPVAVAASTLAVFVLFAPVRGHIGAAVERRFYRRRYDAAHEIEGFAARVRDEVELERLTIALAGTLERTMQPASASIWLRETSR